MYRKKTSSWLKHWDFILLDLILLELSYLLAHWLYHGTAYYREAPLYRNVFFAIAAIDLVVGLRKDFVEKMAFQAQRPCIREKSDPSDRWKKEL